MFRHQIEREIVQLLIPLIQLQRKTRKRNQDGIIKRDLRNLIKFQTQENIPKQVIIYIKPKDDDSNNWERITIIKRATKGINSPHGPYYNFKRQNGNMDGHYIDYFHWHHDSEGQNSVEDVATDINTYISENYYESMNSKDDRSQEINTSGELDSLVVFVLRKDHTRSTGGKIERTTTF